MQRTSRAMLARRAPQLRAAVLQRRAFSAVSGAPRERFLVTGANGQIGFELVARLRQRHGAENVVATDVRTPLPEMSAGPFEYLDVTDSGSILRAVVNHRTTTIVHLASILSAAGERNPGLAKTVNSRGMENVLETAAAQRLRVYSPSTIAVFGPSTPRDNTPDLTILRPTTMYGITKVYAELLGEWYAKRFDVDFRSIRYPGVISNAALPGGGTTDYAVDIYYHALRSVTYKCFLSPDTMLPMMYMGDCVDGTIQLMEAPREKLKQHVYNMTAFSFTPAQVAASITKKIPGFTIEYAPDFRQAIADSWPKSIDDSCARNDWGWNPRFDLDMMTTDMLKVLHARLTLNGEKLAPLHF